MKRNVLLVDDDRSVLEGLKRVLRKEPYEIYGVTSAEGALSIVEGMPVDIVVTDEEMPGMSGTELLRTLRELFPDTVGIMLTGRATLDVALQAINTGEIYRFFTKPCNEVDLALAIREALQQKALIAQSRRLVDLMKMQNAYLRALEQDNPGISTVKRQTSGAVILESQKSLDEVLGEVIDELEKAEKHLGVKKGS